MKPSSEIEILASFIGKELNLAKFYSIASFNSNHCAAGYLDCDNYLIRSCDYACEPFFVDLFEIDEALLEDWRSQGIRFDISFFTQGDAIVGCQLHKYRILDQKPAGDTICYEMEPDRRELHLAKRILCYITSKIEIAEDDIRHILAVMLKHDPANLSAVEDFIREASDFFFDDLDETAFRLAVRLGAFHYVEGHCGDVEINDCDEGCSSYLLETENEAMLDLLKRYGACRSWDDFEDFRFALETVNGTILAFSEDFRSEVLDAYLAQMSLSRDDLILHLEENATPNLSELDDILEGLGMAYEDGEFVFTDSYTNYGYEIKDILEDLGWNCEFEGDAWKFETLGVFYIE